jgi:hypothetical protein
MADYAIDTVVDITSAVCPVTFVKTKVAIDHGRFIKRCGVLLSPKCLN